jgi:NADH-quinone oxidoreductase subunit E
MAAPVGGPTTLIEPSLYEGNRTFTRVEAPPPPPPAAPAPAAAPVAAATPVASPAAVPAAPQPAAVADGRPELHTQPKGGKHDDLELIWGVGPKLREMLNTMGVWHFDQIASWTEKEIAWVDERLEGFKGRILRDDWIDQAKKLASGWRPDNAIGDKPKK